MKNKKVLVLGNFGFANHDLSGQTVKTRVTKELFEKYYQVDDQDFFDTQTLCNKKNIFVLFKKVISCDKLIYLPAHGNLKYLFPIYFLLSYLFRFDIIYSVIGGWLVPYLKNKPMHRWMLKRIRVVLAETTRMKKDLEQTYGFGNVEVLYNFRTIDFQPQVQEHEALKLVFMARIDPNKGLDTIIDFCKMVNSLSPRPNITVDFYGPYSPNITEKTFLDSISGFEFVKYHGALEPEEIHSVISDYDVLILPTHYYTEGLPGSLIDAYMAGLPAIVSDWMHAQEFVADGQSGIIVPFEHHQKEFNDAVMKLYMDRELLRTMKVGAIKQSQKFTASYAWKTISPYIMEK
jgi:glycosyltransferase involved in cell wall biosynthesis